MKRIEFIAPVEAMRGNLSGRQDLLYAENDNPAYDGPLGYTNYARNYSARFIGAKVAKNGLKYFTVRTKTCNHLTNKSKKAMALLGGTGAIVGAIMSNHSSAVYTGLQAQWVAIQELGDTRTFRKYLSDGIRSMLVAKAQQQVFAGPATAVTIKNPWYDGSQTTGATVSNSILVKFWGELHANGIYFTVDGMKGIATAEDIFAALLESDYNVLNLTESNGYMKLGTSWLKNSDGEYITNGDDIDAVNPYVLTSVAPE